MNLKILLCALNLCLITKTYSSDEAISVSTIYEKASNHVLKIDVKEIYSAYGSELNSTGSGFWLGGESRLIITNSHIASPKSVSKYEAVDLDGNRFSLKLIYTNPIIDLSYLIPEDDQISQPESTFEYCLKTEKNSNVYMIGNNGGNGIVQQDGTVSDNLSIEPADFPRKSITVSINGKGGSSGSMVINKDGKIIGVNYLSSDVASFVIPAEFVVEDITYLKMGSIPPKNDIGLTFKHIAADEAQKYFNFILKSPKDYNNLFNGARSRLLQVNRCLGGTPAEEYFEPGDIITMVNNEPIGPDLFKFHNLINEHNLEKIQITYFRNGHENSVDVPIYNLNEKPQPEMIIFGKSIFTCVDSIYGHLFGLPIGSVALFQNPLGNIFSDDIETVNLNFNNRSCAAFLIKKINDSFINNLDDIEKIIPEITRNHYFSYLYESHSSAYQKPLIGHSHYDHEDHQTPIRLTYDWSTQKWVKKEIR